MSTTEFHAYIMNDVLAEIDGITSRRMFSGFGIYRYGKIFAFIIDDTLYFKVGNNNRPHYEKAGSKQFTYTHKSGKEVQMPYWEVPSDVMEDKKRLQEWVDASCAT